MPRFYFFRRRRVAFLRVAFLRVAFLRVAFLRVAFLRVAFLRVTFFFFLAMIIDLLVSVLTRVRTTGGRSANRVVPYIGRVLQES